MEFFSLFLSTFMELANRVGNIEKSKLQDRKDLFNNIIAPLFNDLEPAADNYMNFFREARKLINGATKRNIPRAAYSVLKVREEMALTRIKVREMAKEMGRHIDDKDVLNFAKAIDKFFYCSPDFPLPTLGYKPRTRSETIMIFMRLLENEQIKKTEVVHFIDETLMDLEKSWALIVKSYEKIKIHLTSSPKLIRKR